MLGYENIRLFVNSLILSDAEVICAAVESKRVAILQLRQNERAILGRDELLTVERVLRKEA